MNRAVKVTWRGVLALATSVLWTAPWASAQEAAGPDLVKLDPAAAVKDADGNRLWYDLSQLDIEGKGWADTEAFYDRLPAKAKGVVTDSVWGLSKDSAGLCARFVTDADAINARWTLNSNGLAMPHMPATGVSGLDLYVNDNGVWRWIGAGRPDKTSANEATLASGIPAGLHEYMLYLPLYNGVSAVELGLPVTAILAKAPPRAPERSKPIVFYGTSITQGGCASRPGMAYSAILGRRLGYPVINLGFSGSGRMEMAMEELLAELDAAVYVLDCLPNMNPALIDERLELFVVALRKARPDTPIVLVENIRYQAGAFLPAPRQSYESKNKALRAAYDRLTAQGVAGLTYVPCDALLGDDGEATVDGTHMTDLGFQRYSDALEPILRAVLH